MAASRNPLGRLIHIRDEIVALRTALQGVAFHRFKDDYVLRRMTEHALLIISEAAKALPDELIALEPQIPWRDVRGIGNVLRHDYFDVNPLVLWDVVVEYLPDLAAAVDSLILHVGLPGSDPSGSGNRDPARS